MNVAIQSESVGWVIDNIVNDYVKLTRHKIVNFHQNPDIFWCANLFSFPQIVNHIPSSCTSVLHIHHIDEDNMKVYNFDEFNKADCCIVCNKKVEDVAKKYMTIPIYRLDYWVLSHIVQAPYDQSLRKEFAEKDELLIGSFVKDGNGKKGDTPKLCKGPDILINILKLLSKKIKIKVILGGYARQYVIQELKSLNIPFIYLEKYPDIAKLYDCLDWYLVTARTEGGPQSVLEASYRKVKILSRDVGLAPEVLHPDCICQTVEDFVQKIETNLDQREYNYNKVLSKHMPKQVVARYDDFFEIQGIKK